MSTDYDEDFDLDPSTPTWMVIVGFFIVITYVML